MNYRIPLTTLNSADPQSQCHSIAKDIFDSGVKVGLDLSYGDMVTYDRKEC
jgi:hypothetical protein